ncbi:protein kinase [Streptomyces sp. NPDC056347]|uniref:protein kinase domain-containing protein n=1 Tax=Streptomyces sp. NPDC056347 TaxID=3345790 RepID=UPI0035E1B922
MRELLPADPRKVGPYRLLARLGAGGMGEVFLGRSPGGRTVAVKVVRRPLAEDVHFRRRFSREVAAARRVGGFYTAQVVDADTEADQPWLVTSYIPGPSLREAVTAYGPFPAEAVAGLGAGLAEGLRAIHACGVVHRDLKPGNVLLADDGPRVIDFGIARALDETSELTRSGVVGTPAYMSPEQIRGEEAGPAGDVFCLAAVLAWTATGEAPFGGGRKEAVMYRVVHEEPDLTGVPATLAPLIAAGLAKAPGTRPGVDEILDRCAALAGPDGLRLPDAVAELIDERVVRTMRAVRTAPTVQAGRTVRTDAVVTRETLPEPTPEPAPVPTPEPLPAPGREPKAEPVPFPDRAAPRQLPRVRATALKSPRGHTSVALPRQHAMPGPATGMRIVRWHKRVGDEVAVDEPLFDVAWKGGGAVITAPVAGTILTVYLSEATTARVGAVAAVIGTPEEKAPRRGWIVRRP